MQAEFNVTICLEHETLPHLQFAHTLEFETAEELRLGSANFTAAVTHFADAFQSLHEARNKKNA